MREVQFRLVIAAALNYGVNNVGLPLLGHLLAHELPDVGGPLLGHAVRDDGSAARRQFVENAHVQIAVKRQRERARNWGGRHHQHVRLRLVWLLHQFETLKHPESVLLVDYD